jgi:hypothetical protein
MRIARALYKLLALVWFVLLKFSSCQTNIVLIKFNNFVSSLVFIYLISFMIKLCLILKIII